MKILINYWKFSDRTTLGTHPSPPPSEKVTEHLPELVEEIRRGLRGPSNHSYTLQNPTMVDYSQFGQSCFVASFFGDETMARNQVQSPTVESIHC